MLLIKRLNDHGRGEIGKRRRCCVCSIKVVSVCVPSEGKRKVCVVSVCV